MAPIFAMMAFGYGATFTRVFDEAAARALASFVFYFAIPLMLFRSMATNPLLELAPEAALTDDVGLAGSSEPSRRA